MGLLRVILPVTALTLALGCENNPTELERDDGLTRIALGGLQQTVVITPAEPTPGDRIQITSTVINHGRTPEKFESRICGLDLEADFDLQWPSGWGECLGYSMSGDLAPGQSLSGGTVRVINSPPGEYSLRVRHLLKPELWIEVKVAVRAP